MNNTEAAKVLSMLKAAYPNAYKDISDQDAKTAIRLWQIMFEDKPYEVVTAALKAAIATSKWVPTIAEVNEKIQALTAPPVLDEMEAWELVRKAISNGIYESKKEFDKLPPAIQKSVGSHNMLREWAMMDTSTVQSVTQSNFMRTYRAKAMQEKEFAMMPESSKAMFLGVSEQMKSFPQPDKTDDERRAFVLKELDGDT